MNARSSTDPTAGPPASAKAAPFWCAPAETAFAAVSARTTGLSSAEAAARLSRFGPNQPEAEPERALVLQLLARFKNPLVIILLLASAVSAATGDPVSATIVIAMVILSVTLDFVQEHRASQAVERLRRSVQVRATVLRDGQAAEIPLAAVVPGDVALLSAGDLVPGDGLVLEARDLFVDQALLTGEPYPVEKHAQAGGGEPGADLTSARSAAFLGTSVLSGSGRMLIVRTGSETAFGDIARALSSRPPPTAFTRGIHRFGMLILRLTMLLVLFVVLVNAAFHRPLLESFLFAVALAVGLTPELLPMVVTITLSRGAVRMAAKKVIVKRLSAVQDLGSMDVLCTDKTGTLTEARIHLAQHVDPRGQPSARVLTLAYLNSHFETGLRSPLDEAILRDAKVDATGWAKIDEIPFDFERRRVSVLVARGRERVLVVKGAPEDVLASSTHLEVEGGPPVPLDEDGRAAIRAQFAAFGRDGYRVLGIASRPVAEDCDHARLDDESTLAFAGLVAFLDPPKASARAALEALARAGIAVKVLSGDDEHVTEFVCRSLGLAPGAVLTGKAIAALDEPALLASVERTQLFCRVTPAQKLRIIRALQRRGHTVGYLGDGINDAPSLHAADVGMSVDSAVDVAKAAADMVLLESDLSVLHSGVIEGRRTFGNVMKYIMMGTSSNFGNMFSMAGATLVLPFLPMLPVQVLLNNFLYDLSELPIPADEVDPEDLAEPRRWDMDFIRNFMLVLGPISSIFDFATFAVLLYGLHASVEAFRTGWFVESLATQVLVIFVIRTRRRPLGSRPARPLVIAALLAVATGVALPFTPLGARAGLVPLPATTLMTLAVLTLVYLVVAEQAKRLFYRHVPRRAAMLGDDAGVVHLGRGLPGAPGS